MYDRQVGDYIVMAEYCADRVILVDSHFLVLYSIALYSKYLALSPTYYFPICRNLHCICVQQRSNSQL